MDKVNLDDLRHDDLGYMLHEGVSFTGIGIDYWENGQLASEINFVDGIEDGWSRGWHRNGRMSTEAFYQKGRVKGIHRKWHENGQLKLEEEILDGQAVWSKEWDDKGNVTGEFGGK